MALEDLIARSGAENFETMRRGWLPTQDEKRARSLADLQVQQTQQKADYEPERQRMKRRESNTLEKQRQQAMKKTQQQMDQADTDEKWSNYKFNHEITSKNIIGAHNIWKQTGDISQAKSVIQRNYDEIIEAGGPETDKAVDRFLSKDISNKEAEQMLEQLNAVLPSVQEQINKQDLYKSRGGSNSAIAERYATRIRNGEMLTQEEWNHYLKLTNSDPTKTSALSLEYKRANDKKKLMISSREKAVAATKHIREKNNSITQAFQALESGDNTLSDKLLTAALSNLTESSVRAFKMYEVFDASLGNIVEQFQDWIDRGIKGTRNEEQKAKILTVLQKMQQYNEPVLKRLRKHHRAIAKADGHDPYEVVPPETKEEVAEDDTLTVDQKLKLLKLYGLMKKQ